MVAGSPELSQPFPHPGRSTAVRRLIGVVAWSTAAVLAALGLFAGPVAVLLGVFGAAVAGVAGFAHGVLGGRPPRLVVVDTLRCAAAGAGAVFAAAGLAVLIGVAAVPVVGLAAAAWAWRHRTGWARRSADPQATAAEPGLSGLSNAELSREWRRSHASLLRARTADELARVCDLRRHQLDEMERRGPAGFGRRLSSGAWVLGDSAPFLGG